MPDPLIQPYLFFDGRCEEAITFYKQALNAEVEMLMRFKDSPDPAPEGMVPPGYDEKVLHATLRIGSCPTRSCPLMMSDGCGEGGEYKGVSISFLAASVAEAERVFAALAEGGQVTMPLGETFWSPRFGMVNDQFGVPWMINVEPEAEEEDGPLHLTLSRVVDVPREKLFRGWVEPELLRQWFCPKPWSVSSVEIDPRPGGKMCVGMRSPEGEDLPALTGCYLEVVPGERIVFTDGLGPGYRPNPEPFMTAVITFEDADLPAGSSGGTGSSGGAGTSGGGGTRYTATAMHKSAADRQKHEAMGFHEGWGKCLDQLVALAKTLA